jgi:hypothetical protein
MKIRLEGAALLSLCAFVLHRIYLLVHVPPWHQASASELALGLVAVLTGVAGAAFFLVGPALFRPYAWPPPDGD